MSSLVAYESSDDETTNVPDVTISDSVDQLSRFTSKPVIIQSVKDPINNRTKIIIEEHPNEYDDSDSEDEAILHQSKRLKTRASSLLSMLPAPTATSIKDDDENVRQSFIELNSYESNYFDDSLSDEDANNSDNDDNLSLTGPHYFSLNKLDKPIEMIEPAATLDKYKSSDISNEAIYSVNKSEETHQHSFVTELPQLPFDEKLVSELSRMCKRGHSFKWTSVQADELRGNSNEQLLKNITTDDEMRSSDKSKMLDNPVAKRKHQMTYLANLAKSQEHELRQQWSQSTSNRRESRARYGF